MQFKAIEKSEKLVEISSKMLKLAAKTVKNTLFEKTCT